MRRVVTTIACFVVMAVAVGRMCNPGPSDGGKEVGKRSELGNRVKLNPAGLYYYEGDNVLRLVVELGSDEKGAFYFVYVLTPASWVREMPEWCRNRREEVLAEIRRLTADRRLKWVEEE